MKRLEILKQAVLYQKKQIKKLPKMTWEQKNCYFNLQDRIYYLYLYLFYLSLREKIKKEVKENYNIKTKKQILDSIVEYDQYDSIDFENQFVWKKDLEPFIEKYIEKQIGQIENNTLKLEI